MTTLREFDRLDREWKRLHIRFVQIGSVSGSEITLPSAMLRSSAIELMGSGIGSIPLDRFVNAIGGLLHAATPAGFQIEDSPVSLSDVKRAWPNEDSSRRTVFTVDVQKS